MFHVLWDEHLLSIFIPHHSSILLFHLILCLFISILSYSYSFHRFSFLYSPSHSTSHFHSFSSQHTLSSPFFHSIPVLFFNPYRLICHSILPHYSTLFSFILSSFFPFIPFHIILSLPFSSLSILHSIPFNTTLLSSSSSLFYKSLFDSILSFYSPLCSQTPFYSHSPQTSLFHSSLFIHATSIQYILFSPILSLTFYL